MTDDMVYGYEEVRSASVGYFKGDTLAADVFAGKYALQDLKGNLYELTPSDMHRREAREFVRIEQKYPNPMTEDEVYELLANWDVVPQGGPMSAIGNQHQVQSLSNCFVIEPPYDSYAGILKADQEQVQVMKRRGGVGFDISKIRPRGLAAANAARTTDGIGVFMERFSNTTREVAQGGRRGALMLTLSVHHPEVRTFVNIKRDKSKVTGANISLRLTDEFMQAVKDGTKVQLRFPVEKDATHSIEQDVDAKELWDDIVKAATECAEPGLLFWDTVTKRGPADAYVKEGFQSVSTNPCGEIPLNSGDSCRLLLLNLFGFVKNPFTPKARFDHERFAVATQKAQRLMDDLVDLELEAIDRIVTKIKSDPEPAAIKRTELELWQRIKDVCAKGRRTGLGITGAGDAMAALGVKYGSDKSVAWVEETYKTLCVNAWKSSATMAKERGAFPIYDKDVEKDHEFIQQVLNADPELKRLHAKHGRRNIALTTTSPAGSVSILTQTTSGCEPAYKLTYKRRRKVNPSDKEARVDFTDPSGDRWQEYEVMHHGLKLWMEATGETDIKKSPYWGATAEEIDWSKKVDMQAAAQRWICHAISNTTNLPASATVEDVKQVYMRGWETGCKGITVYRDGSRTGVLVETASAPAQAALEAHTQPQVITETHAPRRPKELPCDITRVNVGAEGYLVLVGILDGRPYEVFAGLAKHIEVPKKAKKGTLIKNGKKDGVATYNLRIPLGDDDELLVKDVVDVFDNPEHGALTRMISLSLRHGVPISFLVEQLRKDKHSDLQSFSTVIARVMKGYIKDGTKSTDQKLCPECGSDQVQYLQGCIQCTQCAWSKCA